MEEGYRVGQTKGLIALGLFKDYDDIRNSPTQQFGTYQPGDIKYKDVNGDGVINDGDRVAVGSTRTPNLIYGVGLSAQYKGFDINVHFQGAGKSNFLYMEKPCMLSVRVNGKCIKGLVDDNRWISPIFLVIRLLRIKCFLSRLSYGGNANNYRIYFLVTRRIIFASKKCGYGIYTS